MKRLTLRVQLARAALATTLAALLLNAVLVLAYEFDRYREARSRDLHTQAEILKQAIAPALVFDDPAVLHVESITVDEHGQREPVGGVD